MSPLEKVKNRFPIQNMLTFCYAILSIEKSTRWLTTPPHAHFFCWVFLCVRRTPHPRFVRGWSAPLLVRTFMRLFDCGFVRLCIITFRAATPPQCALAFRNVGKKRGWLASTALKQCLFCFRSVAAYLRTYHLPLRQPLLHCFRPPLRQ